MKKVIMFMLMAMLAMTVSAQTIETVAAEGCGETYAKALEDAQTTISEGAGPIIAWGTIEDPRFENGRFYLKIKARVAVRPDFLETAQTVHPRRYSHRKIKSDLLMTLLKPYMDCFSVVPGKRLPEIDKEGNPVLYLNYEFRLDQEKYQAYIKELEERLPDLGFQSAKQPPAVKSNKQSPAEKEVALRLYTVPRNPRYLTYFEIKQNRLDFNRMKSELLDSNLFCTLEFLDKDGNILTFRRFCIMPTPLYTGGNWESILVSLSPPAKPLKLHVDVNGFSSSEDIARIADIRSTLTYEETGYTNAEMRWVSTGWHGHRLPQSSEKIMDLLK